MSSIRVLVVDDSAFMRHAISRLLGEAPDITVVGSAADGEAGLRLCAELRPDVVTLDVEMPVLDGLAMLRRLMVETPTRVVMLSSLTTAGAAVTIEALNAGAIDIVAKPGGSLSIDVGRMRDDLYAKIRAAAAVTDERFLAHRRRTAGALRTPAGPVTRPASTERSPARPRATAVAPRLVVIASSTGGPSALHAIVTKLPPLLGAGLAIVQHMPPGFTASLAAHLQAAGSLRAAEAVTGELLVQDEIVVAKGDHHLVSTLGGRVQLSRMAPVNNVRPAADVTLQSVAPVWRDRLLCVVLTGMGVDGREGARAVKAHGGTVFAQDEATSTIYGMPAAVVNAGLADEVVSLDAMAERITAWCGSTAEPAFAGARIGAIPHGDATPSAVR